MILRLRQSHRIVVFALGVVLPMALIAGVALREQVPVVDPLPVALVAPQKFTIQVWQRGDLFGKEPVNVCWLSDGNAEGVRALNFSTGKNFVKPDLLVYWTTNAPGDLLPGNAILLGGFGAAALRIPAGIMGWQGVLVLYSLADGVMVDVSQPVRLTDTTR